MGNQLAVTRPSATLIEYVADGRNGRNSKAHMQLRKDLTPFLLTPFQIPQML